MNTVHLTNGELETARNALQAYLRAFGHDEADILAQIKAVIEKLDAAESEQPSPIFVG